MKLRFLLVSALALAFMVPAALANDSTDGAVAGDDAPASVDETTKADDTATENEAKKVKKAKRANKGKKHAMRDLCRPRVGIVVRGELVAVDAEAGTFTVAVDRANRHGKRFVDGEATFKLAMKGKVRKHGKATLADLQVGYLVKVMARGCKSELKDDVEAPELYAMHVKVKAPVVVDENAGNESEKAEDETEETKDGSTTDAV